MTDHMEIIMKPQRIQRKRTKGWRMPENTVYVGRGSKWGNPWRVWRDPKLQRWIAKADHNASYEKYLTREEAIAAAVRWFKAWAWHLRDDLPELAGKNLACWCKLDQPCHAEILLELANGEQA